MCCAGCPVVSATGNVLVLVWCLVSQAVWCCKGVLVFVFRVFVVVLK